MSEQEYDTFACGATRDLYPEQPGLVVLVCGRAPHQSGKHIEYAEDGTVSAEFWGSAVEKS